MATQTIRPYLVEMGVAIALYSVAVPLCLWLAHERLADTPARFVVAALPVLPALLALRAMVRQYRRLDELQQRVLLEALVFAFGCGCVLTMTYGFLELVGLPRLSWVWIAPGFIALLGVGAALGSRRYA